MTVLVTGGSGFIGSAVVRTLLERGHRIQATRTGTGGPPSYRHDRLQWLTWDATAGDVPVATWPEIGAIVHLSTSRRPFDFPAEARALYETNTGATLRLLEAARKHGVPRFLLGSTGDVLSPAAPPSFESDVQYAPSSFYAATKASAEMIATAYASQLQTAILRIFHPYGPSGERFLINRMLDRVASGQTVQVEGVDGVSINPVWIDDLAAGISQAVESSATGVFHLPGPDRLSFRGMLELMGEVAGRAPVIVQTGAPGVERHDGDYRRSSDLLGYKPAVGLREGLQRLLTLARAASET